MARGSQASSQLRQNTPFSEKQLVSMVARHGQSDGAAGLSAPASQASAQALQKVQAPRAKSTTGSPEG